MKAYLVGLQVRTGWWVRGCSPDRLVSRRFPAKHYAHSATHQKTKRKKSEKNKPTTTTGRVIQKERSGLPRRHPIKGPVIAVVIQSFSPTAHPRHLISLQPTTRQSKRYLRLYLPPKLFATRGRLHTSSSSSHKPAVLHCPLFVPLPSTCTIDTYPATCIIVVATRHSPLVQLTTCTANSPLSSNYAMRCARHHTAPRLLDPHAHHFFVLLSRRRPTTDDRRPTNGAQYCNAQRHNDHNGQCAVTT
mgnify:CR=1 FL=1